MGTRRYSELKVRESGSNLPPWACLLIAQQCQEWTDAAKKGRVKSQFLTIFQTALSEKNLHLYFLFSRRGKTPKTVAARNSAWRGSFAVFGCICHTLLVSPIVVSPFLFMLLFALGPRGFYGVREDNNVAYEREIQRYRVWTKKVCLKNELGSLETWSIYFFKQTL